jgi:uncharacterized repeat protein (TIGR02543 family)
VIFDADGGTPAITTAQTSYGNNRVSLPASNPSKPGYVFGGWRTAANGGGTVFSENTPVTADTTVYARWISASDNANLAALSVNAGPLDPPFNPGNRNYEVTVPYATTSIAVSATPADLGARYEQFPSNNPVSLNVGRNSITIKVEAENGRIQQYLITVTRTPLSSNANLKSLEVIGGTLNPAFVANITAYTALVPQGTVSVTLNATAAALGATLSQQPANPVSLGTTPRNISVTVRAEDGTAKTYTVTVSKATAVDIVDVVIGIADQRIDLTRSTENDLSREAGNVLRLTAPPGYDSYTWRVDDVSRSTSQDITFSANSYGLVIGTHSVLLVFTKDGISYGCEVLFQVSR